jgi:hypothetical protein
LQINDRLRIQTGPMRGLFWLYVGQAPHARVALQAEALDDGRGSAFWINAVGLFLLRLSKTCGFRNLFGAACGRHCAVRH